MAEKFVSPGVFTRENDESFLSQGVAQIGTAIVGTFPKGPAFAPTVISSVDEFRQKFGGENENYYASYAAKNVLSNASQVTVVRVGELGGYTATGATIIATSGSATTSVTFAPTVNSAVDNTISITSAVKSGANVILQTSEGNFTASFDPSSENYYTKLFGISPRGSKGLYVYSNFETTDDTIADYTALTIVSESAPLNFTQDASFASTPYIKSQDISGTTYNLFKFHTLNTGTDTNREVKVSIQNVKRASEINDVYGRFDVVVRQLSDTDARPVVIETFAGCDLNPSSQNYISRVIGDRYISVDTDGNVTTNGDYRNRSSYIRVEVTANIGALPTTVVPGGFNPYFTPLNLEVGADIPDLPLVTDIGTSDRLHYGINFDSSTDWKSYVAPLVDSPVSQSSAFALPTSLFGVNDTSSTIQKKRRFTLAFQGGFTGNNPTTERKMGIDATSTNVGGLDLSTSTASGSVAFIRALNAISNPLEYDYNLLVTPGVAVGYGTSVIDRAKEIVEDRSDAFYIADLTWIGDTIDGAVGHAASYDSSYMASYYPWIKIIDSTTARPVWVPPSTVMAGVFAFSDSISAEWFAPAGLNRGNITEAINIYKKLKRSDLDTLYEAKVNPIAFFPGQGIVAYGQKTLQVKASALDRINVRRLLINLKKFISASSRFLVFEQNTDETRNRFLSLVEPYLDSVQQNQGIFSYRVVVDSSVNTPDVIDRNQLVGKIYIQPVKAAEFIILDFNVLPSGAEFPA